MINKQNLCFFGLFSLVLALSIYYITMPNKLLTEVKNGSISDEPENFNIANVSSLVAMRVSLEEKRQEQMDILQQQLTKENISGVEKNNVYEKLKYLNKLQSEEEKLEKEINKNFKLDCFIKIDNSNVSCVCVSEKHDNILANDIMRFIQNNYKNKMYITIKFQKS